MKQIFSVSIVGGDAATVSVTYDGEVIRTAEWHVVGRLSLFDAVEKLKTQILVEKKKLPIPSGKTPEQLLLRKLVLQMRGEWGDEPSDPELCHCRKISQENVERAIILGAHTIEKVRARSAANTSCGTCLPDVEALFQKYLA